MTRYGIDTAWYQIRVAMTLMLDDLQTGALRPKAEAEQRSMQQVALAAIEEYVHQPTPQRRGAVPVAELQTMFADLPPMDARTFRADLVREIDPSASFDSDTANGPDAAGIPAV